MKSHKRFILAAVLMLAAFFMTSFLSTTASTPLAKELDRFPKNIGDYTLVRTQTFDKEVVDTAGMDDYLMWHYQDKSGYSLGLYIGYYEEQTEGGIIHSPKNCMPGSGWQAVKSITTPVDIPQRTVNINQMLLQKGAKKQLAHYWYFSRGRVVANEYLDRILMIFDSITKRRSDGALIRITGPGSQYDLDVDRQSQFIESLMPLLGDFLPE